MSDRIAEGDKGRSVYGAAYDAAIALVDEWAERVGITSDVRFGQWSMLRIAIAAELRERERRHLAALQAAEERAREEERQACRLEALRELGKEVHPLTASRIADRIAARTAEGDSARPLRSRGGHEEGCRVEDGPGEPCDCGAAPDPLHPFGRCTCCGEGRCEWCRRIGNKIDGEIRRGEDELEGEG